MQELRVESAGRALMSHACSIILHAWNSTRRISYLTIPGHRKIAVLNWRKEKELESQSTVNEITVQIQELHDTFRVQTNSNDFGGFWN